MNQTFRFNKNDDTVFSELYKNYFILVKKFIIKNSGTCEDAEDIFQDTMIVLVQKLKRDDFELTASVKAYILGISKNLWFKKIRDSKITLEFSEEHDSLFFEEIEYSIQQEKTYLDKLADYMHKITTHCKGLIHDMFMKSKPIEQIQTEYGYSSKHTALNQKYKCIEQIRKIKEIEEKSSN